MPKSRTNCLVGGRSGVTALGILLTALLLPVSLRAGKKKADAAPQVPVGERRVTGYFDVAKIVWPNPPASPRIAFQDLYTGQKVDPSLYVKKARKETWMDRLAGTQTSDEIKMDNLPFQLIRTYGVGVDSKGRIYAADQSVGAVFIFDPEHKGHVELIGNGRQANFDLIVGVALDDDDSLFVTDAKLHHVLEFNPQHEAVASFGADVLVRPGGVAIDRQNRFLYVADTGNDVVDVFDADKHTLLRQIGKPSTRHQATAPGLFSMPEAVAVDQDGSVYVTDTFNDRVEIFDSNGKFISTFGQNGDAAWNLERPKGIAVDSDGHIWVVDAAQNLVKVFNQQGRLLIYFGGQGYYPGQFMGPFGIAISRNNRVIVSETFPGRVQVFRYITDAEAAAMKARRDGEEQKSAAATGQSEAPPTATPAAPAVSADQPASTSPAAH